MRPQELVKLIEGRDEDIDEIDPYLPKTLATLMDRYGPYHQRAQFRTGAVLSKVDTLNEQRDDVQRVVVILKYEEPQGQEYFFRVPLYYNSWDDGLPDEWDFDGEIRQVVKTPVTTFKWEDA